MYRMVTAFIVASSFALPDSPQTPAPGPSDGLAKAIEVYEAEVAIVKTDVLSALEREKDRILESRSKAEAKIADLEKLSRQKEAFDKHGQLSADIILRLNGHEGIQRLDRARSQLLRDFDAAAEGYVRTDLNAARDILNRKATFRTSGRIDTATSSNTSGTGRVLSGELPTQTPASANLLRDNSEIEVWRKYVVAPCQGHFVVKDKELEFHCDKVDGTAFHVQFSQLIPTLVEGKEYELEFEVKGEVDRNFRVTVSVDRPDYHDIGFRMSKLQATTSYRSHTYTFVAKKGTEGPHRLVFDLGEQTGSITLRNLSLRRKASG